MSNPLVGNPLKRVFPTSELAQEEAPLSSQMLPHKSVSSTSSNLANPRPDPDAQSLLRPPSNYQKPSMASHPGTPERSTTPLHPEIAKDYILLPRKDADAMETAFKEYGENWRRASGLVEERTDIVEKKREGQGEGNGGKSD